MIDGYNKPTYIYGGYLTVPSILKNKREMPDCTRINILIARRKKKDMYYVGVLQKDTK